MPTRVHWVRRRIRTYRVLLRVASHQRQNQRENSSPLLVEISYHLKWSKTSPFLFRGRCSAEHNTNKQRLKSTTLNIDNRARHEQSIHFEEKKNKRPERRMRFRCCHTDVCSLDHESPSSSWSPSASRRSSSSVGMLSLATVGGVRAGCV